MTKPSANGANGSKWIRPDRRLAIYLRDGFRCLYCGRDLHGSDPFQVTLDHLKPGHFPGNHAESNLVTACRSCNSARQDKPWRKYAPGGAIPRIARHRRRKLARYLKLARAIIAGEVGMEEAIKEA